MMSLEMREIWLVLSGLFFAVWIKLLKSIMNYDETNFTDNPGVKKVYFETWDKIPRKNRKQQSKSGYKHDVCQYSFRPRPAHLWCVWGKSDVVNMERRDHDLPFFATVYVGSYFSCRLSLALVSFSFQVQSITQLVVWWSLLHRLVQNCNTPLLSTESRSENSCWRQSVIPFFPWSSRTVQRVQHTFHMFIGKFNLPHAAFRCCFLCAVKESLERSSAGLEEKERTLYTTSN